MACYFFAFIPAKEGGYAILSPDFPELASQGDDLDDCMGMGADALAVVVEEYTKSRRELPGPSSLEQAKAFAATEMQDEGVDVSREPLLQLFKAPNADMIPVKISISLPKADLEAIDAKAKRLGMTRSGLMATAARAY